MGFGRDKYWVKGHCGGSYCQFFWSSNLPARRCSGQTTGVRRRFLLYFLAEIGSAVLAVVLFRLISNRFVAGSVAGFAFILLGLFIFGFGLVDHRLRVSWSFRIACLHLFFVSIPMLSVRLSNFGVAFGDLAVWGIPGPSFHKVSEGVYLALVVGTLIDAYRARPEHPKSQPLN